MNDILTINYIDPLSYPEVPLHELISARQDCRWTKRPSAEYLINDTMAEHSYSGAAICPDDGILVKTDQPPEFILFRTNVYLSGYRCYTGADGAFCLDQHVPASQSNQYIRKLVGTAQYQNELCGFSAHRDDIVFNLAGREIVEITEPVISFTSDEAPNYGSFIVKILPKVNLIKRLPPDVRILVPSYIPSISGLLQMAGINPARLIPQELNKVYKLDSVYVPSMTNPDFWLSESTLDFYCDLRARFGRRMDRRKKIFVSRADFRAFHGRHMQNQLEVSELVTARGFEIASPEKLTPYEQVQLFSSARVILGASGSGMFNAVFSHPSSLVIDIESEPHWYNNHRRLFASAGLQYILFEAEPETRDFSEHHLPFTVDTQRLNDIIEQYTG